MADRFPLIANSSANQIQELAAADQLNLTSSNLILGDSSGSTNNRIKLGASGDLEIYHDGNNSFVKDSGTGTLHLDTNGTKVQIFADSTSSKTMANFIKDGAVELYHSGTKRLETTSGGINVTGALNVNGSALQTGPLLQVKYIERTAARATAANGSSWAEALETQFRCAITPTAVGNTIVVHLFLGYTAGNGTIGSMIPVYHDGSTAYSMVGSAGSSSYTVPATVLSAGYLAEDLRNNSGNTQWFNANKTGRYITTNTNAATIRLYSRNQAGSFSVGDNSQACSMLVMEYQGDIDITT